MVSIHENMSEYKKISIKNWAVEDRPREKLAKLGKRSLSDAELMAILLGSGNLEESAVELSRRILAAFDNNLGQLLSKSIGDLTIFKGVGEAKAITIIAALELGKRLNHCNTAEKPKITSSNDAAQQLFPILTDLEHEEFWILFLNRQNQVIENSQLSKGGLSGTVIDVRLIMKRALEKLASGIIISHNHPSGNLLPSSSDRDITEKIKQAGQVFDIKLLDHIIICGNRYTSFNDEGWL